MTAAQARTLTRTSEKPLNVIFRGIKEQAEYGMCKLTYCVDSFDIVVIDKLIDTFVQANYKVTKIEEDNKIVGLEICW